MERAKARTARRGDKRVRELSQLMGSMGCKLKKIDDNKYQVMSGLEDTGLQLHLGRETTEKSNNAYVLAVMTFPIPENDQRFHQSHFHEETGTFPHVKAILGNNKYKAVLFEFIAKSLHYFAWSKLLRKWRCYNCLEEGYEVFLVDGSVNTFDRQFNEFSLVIAGQPNIQGIVFDDLIGNYVLPVCADCREHLDYEFSTGCGVAVDTVYFQRLLVRWPETARVMRVNYS